MDEIVITVEGTPPMPVKCKKDILRAYGISVDRMADIEREIRASDNPLLDELLKNEKAIINEKLMRIEAAIAKLDDDGEKRVLWLCYVGKIREGRRRRLLLWEVANEMGYSEDWVKKKHASALKNLVF